MTDPDAAGFPASITASPLDPGHPSVPAPDTITAAMRAAWPTRGPATTRAANAADALAYAPVRPGEPHPPGTPAKAPDSPVEGLYATKVAQYRAMRLLAAQKQAIFDIAAIVDRAQGKVPGPILWGDAFVDAIDDILLALDESGNWPDSFGRSGRNLG